MRRLNEIIIHCTATPEGRAVSVAEIRRWHKQRGWADIGYHYVVHLDGRIENGRPLDQVGAHVAGRNARTVGIAYVGGVDKAGRPKDTRTTAQKAALRKIIAQLLGRFPSITAISGHRDYANKACPCFDARKEYAPVLGIKPAAQTQPDDPGEPPAETAADGAAEMPWWRRNPVLRQITATGSALGVTGGTLLGVDYRAIIALALVGAAVAITAMVIQARKPASTEGLT